MRRRAEEVYKDGYFARKVMGAGRLVAAWSWADKLQRAIDEELAQLGMEDFGYPSDENLQPSAKLILMKGRSSLVPREAASIPTPSGAGSGPASASPAAAESRTPAICTQLHRPGRALWPHLLRPRVRVRGPRFAPFCPAPMRPLGH